MSRAIENDAKSQNKMKENYDKNASAGGFEPGDKVLLFLPLGNSKLESKWQGPFVISRKVNDVNYEVMMPNKRKSTRTIHVNMMKLWYDKDHEQRMAECHYIIADIDSFSVHDKDGVLRHKDDGKISIDIGLSYYQTQTRENVSISESLTTVQQEEVQAILKSYSNVFSDVPGRTHLVQHEIKTEGSQP